MAERDQKTIALVASRLLAAYMTAKVEPSPEADTPRQVLFAYINGFQLYDESEHADGVEHLLFTFADLADRLIICSDPAAIDAWQADPE